MFRLFKSHHQASYIHLKCYILARVRIVGPHIANKLLKYSLTLWRRNFPLNFSTPVFKM
jgi:hypothetical protein